MSIELQPSIVAISDHCAKAEESCGSIGAGVNRRHKYCSDQIKQRPNAAEDQLDLDPRNSEESLDNVKEIKHEQNAGEPKADHRHGIEIRAMRVVCVFRCQNTYKAEKIEDLNTRFYN